MTLFDGVLIALFCISVKALSNNEILNENINSFEDKDFHRAQLLILHSFYFCFIIIKNLVSNFFIAQAL